MWWWCGPDGTVFSNASLCRSSQMPHSWFVLVRWLRVPNVLWGIHSGAPLFGDLELCKMTTYSSTWQGENGWWPIKRWGKQLNPSRLSIDWLMTNTSNADVVGFFVIGPNDVDTFQVPSTRDVNKKNSGNKRRGIKLYNSTVSTSMPTVNQMPGSGIPVDSRSLVILVWDR